MVDIRIFDLRPIDGRKSFYGKAVVIEYPNGVKYLKSYDTLVCMIDTNGSFRRLWDGYSVTTMRHVNAFLRYCGINKGGKAFWDSLKVG